MDKIELEGKVSFPKEIKGLKDKTEGFVNVNLNEMIKEKWVLLYFFPSIGTSICNSEVAEFTLFEDEFKSKNIEIIGVSSNDEESFLREPIVSLAEHMLVSDKKLEIIKKFGAKKIDADEANRMTALINPDGELCYYNVTSRKVARSIKNLLDDCIAQQEGYSGIKVICSVRTKLRS